MAQAIIKNPSAINQTISEVQWTLIPGLTATILNGSGWINLDFSAEIYNNVAGPSWLRYRLTLDSVPIPSTERAKDMLQVERAPVNTRHMVKPGSGQHTYSVEGWCQNAGVRINDYRAALIIQEPGY